MKRGTLLDDSARRRRHRCRVLLLVRRLPHGAADRRDAARQRGADGLVVTHPDVSDAHAEELLDHPGAVCVLLDLASRRRPRTDSALLEHVRIAAPDAPIVVLADRRRRGASPPAIRAGAQDFLLQLRAHHPALLGRALRYAIERKRAEVRARPPGAARPADRAPQPRAVPRPARRRARPLAPHGRPGRRAVPRRRQLQGDQRLARARGRRPAARPASADRLQRDAAPDGHRRALRRRRVHVPVRGPRQRARGRADRRADQPARPACPIDLDGARRDRSR